jgi:hypothetical protein
VFNLPRVHFSSVPRTLSLSVCARFYVCTNERKTVKASSFIFNRTVASGEVKAIARMYQRVYIFE